MNWKVKEFPSPRLSLLPTFIEFGRNFSHMLLFLRLAIALTVLFHFAIVYQVFCYILQHSLFSKCDTCTMYKQERLKRSDCGFAAEYDRHLKIVE